MLLSISSLWARLDRNATVPRIQGSVIHRAKKTLATAAVSDDIVAVRHDLPHMPSLGVSSLDSRPPWQRGGLLFSPVPPFPDLCAALGRAAVQHSPASFRPGTRFIRPQDGPPPGY